MTSQIIISPSFADHHNYACGWQIEQKSSSKDVATKIRSGQIKPGEFNSNQISFIAEELTKLCEIEAKQNGKPLDLKFDCATCYSEGKTINTIDFFRLYGLLSVKLNPLTIQMSSPMNSF